MPTSDSEPGAIPFVLRWRKDNPAYQAGAEAERRRIRDGIEAIVGFHLVSLRIQRAITAVLDGGGDAS